MEDVYWECFFNNAGISGPASKEYALLFVKNKISKAILKHLEENHLKSMGIEPVGDIIRILKYIKNFPQLDKIPNTPKEIPDSVSENNTVVTSKQVISNEVKSLTSYKKIDGCELPVPVRRIVTPEIEGRYKINNPNKVLNQQTGIKVIQPKISEEKPPIVNAPNRIVMLSQDNYQPNKTQITKPNNVSVLKRLGESLEKYERLNSERETKVDEKPIISLSGYEASRKKLKYHTLETENKLFWSSLSQESPKKISTPMKLLSKSNHEVNKSNVFLRLGAQCNDEANGKADKTNRSSITSDVTIVHSGQSTDSVRKVEATSTTSTFHNFRISKSTSQSIRDRLGYR